MQNKLNVAILAGFVIVTALAGTPVGVRAQAPKPPMTDDEYDKTMKQIGPTFQSLQKNNAAMNHSDGAKDAQKLAMWFQEAQAYWEAKHVDDAIGFAKTAVKAAQDTEQASMAMNMTGLADAQKSMAGACQGCHMAHRERLADGSFRIK
jgi:hypothetical protein